MAALASRTNHATGLSCRGSSLEYKRAAGGVWAVLLGAEQCMHEELCHALAQFCTRLQLGISTWYINRFALMCMLPFGRSYSLTYFLLGVLQTLRSE